MVTNVIPEIPDDLIEATRAANELGVSYTQLRSWMARGAIKRYKKAGWRVLVSKSEVHAAIARAEQIEPDPPSR